MTTERCQFIDESSEITEEQFSKLVPQGKPRGIILLSKERCPYCGRKSMKRTGEWKEHYSCGRCANGDINTSIAHAKAVRLAWKYRAIMRRRCDWCKHYKKYGISAILVCQENTINFYGTRPSAQCPRWEKREENTK